MVENLEQTTYNMDLHPLNSEGFPSHEWRIATPNGKTSDARCKHCGSERAYANYESPSEIWRRLSGKKLNITISSDYGRTDEIATDGQLRINNYQQES